MKKVFFILVVLVASLSAHAQFEQGKGYLGASLSSIDISSQAKQFHFGLNAKAGYLFADNLMATAQVGYNHLEDTNDVLTLGAGARYYIIQNGLYLGASLKYNHTKGYNDLLPGVQLGYAFFVSRTVTIEPELYMDFSTKQFENSAYGLGVGIGIYLFKDQYQIKK